jgi:hypothetical protein
MNIISEEARTEALPGIWLSLDGRYAILHQVLPERSDRPMDHYALRKIDPHMAAVRPGPLGTLGYFLQECSSLDEARHRAENDAYAQACRLSNSEVLDSLPAVALARFYWPISSGCTRGALTVVEEEGRLLARVVGMSRGEYEYEPGIYAEADITSALGRRPPLLRRIFRKEARRGR